MGNIVDIQVSDDKIIFKIPQKNIVHEVDNVACFDSKTHKLMYAGISERAYQELNPNKWKKYKSRMEFAPIFNIVSFSPEAAGMLIWDWWREMVRQGIAGNIIFHAQAKLELNILFDGYETTSLDRQLEFEYLVFKFLYLKRLTINGIEKHWNKKDGFPGSLYLLMTYVAIVLFLILSTVPILVAMMAIARAEFPAFLNFLFSILTLFGILILSAYTGNFISSFLWMLVLKPFFPEETLLRALKYPSSLPQKHKLGKIEEMLARKILLSGK